jgi:hypothetical protein
MGYWRMNLSRLLMFLLVSVNQFGWHAIAGETFSPVGYYETSPGKAGEYNRLSVSALNANSYSVEVTTVYCAYAFSNDCSNARGGQLKFSATLNGNVLVSDDLQRECKIKVVFKAESATIQQAGICPTNPNGPGPKPYARRSPNPQALSD